MTGDVELLRKQLEIAAEVRKRYAATLGRTEPFIGPEDLVLKHGTIYKPTRKKPPTSPIPRMCYQNAYRVAVRKGSQWVYCEGFAVASHGLALEHAWVTRAASPGEAYDLAWSYDERNAYMGIAFKPEFVRAVFKASGRLQQFSVLNAWWMGFPLLTGKVNLADVGWGPPVKGSSLLR